MKWSARALLIVASYLCNLNAAVINNNNNVIENNKEEFVTPLGPNDPVVLDISCAHLFEHTVSTIKGAMLHISIKDKRNYLELTQDLVCKPKFTSNCRVLSGEHVKDLLEENWDWDAPTPKERFSTLMKENCVNDIDAWDVISLDKVHIIEDIPVNSLIHWTNFQPEVLARLIEKSDSKVFLPAPSAENSFYIRRLLDSQFFDASQSDLWTIFDHSFCNLAANKTANIGEALARTFEKVSNQVKGQSHLALIAVRIQTLLLEYAKSKNLPSLDEITRITESYLANTVDTIRRKGSDSVKSLVSKIAPEVSSALSQVTNVELREKITALFNSLFALKENNNDIIIMEEPSLDQFARLVNDYSMEEKDQWISEYISVFAFVKSDFEKNHDLINHFMETAINQIKIFFAPLKSTDKFSLSLIPYRAFRLTNIMLNANIPQAITFIKMINEAVGSPEEKKTPRKTLIEGLKRQDLQAIAMAMIESSDDLRLVASIEYSTNVNSVAITVQRDDGGFVLKDSFKIIVNDPEGFLTPNSFMKHPDFIDAAGVMRGFVEQMLFFIDEYLVESASTSVGGHLKRIRLMSHREIGTFIGAVYAKAFQLNQRPIAALDAEFYRLLGKVNDDKAIEEYFDKAYGDQLLDYKMVLMGQRFTEKEFPGKMRSVVPIPLDEIIMLSPFDKIRDWVPDFADEDQPCPFTRETIITNYFVPLRQKLLDEFKALVANFSNIFSLVFDAENLKFCSNSEAIESLFQTYNLVPQHLIDAIKFRNEDLTISSFFEGHDITIKDALLSFVNQLSSRQLSKLLAVWTGSSTLELAGNSISAEFRTPVAGNTQGYNSEDIFEYCLRENAVEENGLTETVIDRPVEFCSILKKTIEYQKELILSNKKDIEVDSLKLVSFKPSTAYPAKIATCSRVIYFYQQDSIALFQTLVLVVNTPSTDYFDNTGNAAQQQAPQVEPEDGAMDNADQIGDDDFPMDNENDEEGL